MFFLKQSTAAVVKIGPFLDATDGVTPETGLTIAQADVRLSKNGGNYAQKNESSSCTHNEKGEYTCSLNTTDISDLGRLKLMVQVAGACPVWHEYTVLPAAIYDWLVAGSVTKLPADVQAILATALTETESGYLAGRFKDFFDQASATHSVATALSSFMANLTTLETRLSAARAGYLDWLNTGGLVASSAEVTSIQNNTRCVRVVPGVIERPDSGTMEHRVELLFYDTAGNMEAPDAAPTIALVNQAGTDRSARLDSTTMSLVSTGRYRAVYTASDSDDLEQLVWTFSVTEGGQTRLYGNASIIVDTTAVDFTAADRTKLEAAYNKLPSADYLLGGANADGSGYSTHNPAGVWASPTRTLSAFAFTVAANLTQILATALTESGAGRLAAAVKTFFDVATPAKTVNDVGGSGVTQQQVRDAMKLAPGAGDPAAGSVDAHLDDLATGQADIKGTGFVKDTNSLVNVTGAAPITLEVEGDNITVE